MLTSNPFVLGIIFVALSLYFYFEHKSIPKQIAFYIDKSLEEHEKAEKIIGLSNKFMVTGLLFGFILGAIFIQFIFAIKIQF